MSASAWKCSLVLLGLAGMLSNPCRAQLSAGGSVRVVHPYVWRGITRANGPSLQVEGSAGLGLAKGTLSAGIWANVELGEDRSSWLSNLGIDRPGLSEIDYWGRYAFHFDNTTLFAGAIHYEYRGDDPTALFTEHASTTEAFAGVQLNRGRLVPQFTAYVDVDEVEGLYLESALAVHILQLSPRLPIILYFNTLVGFSVLEGRNDGDATEIALFQRESFTHLDLSLALNVVLSRKHAITFDVEPHFELKFDDATRRTGPDPDDVHRQQVWLTLAVSFHPVLVRGHQGR
jgi:hypothetical protein